MNYDIHPSRELVDLFRQKPYQGQTPEKASVLIIGNDANYSEAISSHPFFNSILDYHADGLSFWTEHKSHHPFMLDSYPFDRRTGGVRYHSNFAKMNFTSSDAHHFSFVELLSVPTIGNTGSNRKRFFELMSNDHLRWLEGLVFDGRPKFVLVNQTLTSVVAEISRKKGELKELLKVLRESRVRTSIPVAQGSVIYNGYSFSHSITNVYVAELAQTIRNFLSRSNLVGSSDLVTALADT